MTWAVILSDIPLVLSIHLLLMIARLYLPSGSAVPVSLGLWYVNRDGMVRSANTRTQLVKADLSTLAFKITFTLESGDCVTVWRDSCCDNQYRQLVMVLRQWETKQRAEAPC